MNLFYQGDFQYGDLNLWEICIYHKVTFSNEYDFIEKIINLKDPNANLLVNKDSILILKKTD